MPFYATQSVPMGPMRKSVSEAGVLVVESRIALLNASYKKLLVVLGTHEVACHPVRTVPLYVMDNLELILLYVLAKF